MESGKAKGNRETLPDKTRRALGFVNCVSMSLSPEKKAFWTKDIQVALLGFMLGVRPSVLMDFDLDDTDTIQKYLDEQGFDAFIYRNTMIVDRNAVQRRIAEQPDFARELGWEEGMAIDEWLAQASPSGDDRQRGIIGFFLGFPRSAVSSYANHQISKPSGVDIPGPYGARVLYFTTDAELTEADDVKALVQKSRAAFEEAGLGQFFQDKNRD